MSARLVHSGAEVESAYTGRQPTTVNAPFGAVLAAVPEGWQALQGLLGTALSAMASGVDERGGPAPAGDPRDFAEQVRRELGEVLPEAGAGAAVTLSSLTRLLARGAADPADPACAAHLHCPPLAIAVAAEAVSAALNQSLDSWDQAPAASVFEIEVVRALAGLAGYDQLASSGVLTTGGTESNLMGLLLARDRTNPRTERNETEGRKRRLRVFCSTAAHFSVQRGASLLGLGDTSVVPIPTDAHHRLDIETLARALGDEGDIPAVIVATAGTTDFGSIDPLSELAALAREHRAWLHVDAAYGGGALFSDRLAGLLNGLASADSIALDLHKFGWQPIAAGVFLVRDAGSFAPLDHRAAYLNPRDDEEAGYFSLLGRSLRTTRRADAFKIAVTLRTLGRRRLGQLVDRCHTLSRHAAERIAAQPKLQLAAHPTLSTVVFRYVTESDSDQVNAALRRRLLREGKAVVGRTEIDGGVWLKLTLLNPYTTQSQIDALLSAVTAAGAAEEAR